MNNFIVPIDFSKDSLKGLDLAVLFSNITEVNIQMVYVLTTSTHYKPGTVEEEQKFAQKNFEKLIKEYQAKLGKGSDIGYIVKRGKVYREIVNQANAYKNSILCASTHGASGFEELFSGSNALKIMAATLQPVFTIKNKIPKKIRKIVLPIKLHVATRQKVPIATELAELFGAEVHVLSIATSKNKRDIDRLNSYSKQASEYLKAKNIPVVTKTMIGESLPTLTTNYAEAVDADMIVIMSSSVDKWNVFLGSYAQQMLNRASVPLLSLKPKEKYIPSGFRTFGG